MDYAPLQARLLHTCTSRMLLLAVLALYFAVALIVRVVHFRKTHDNRGISLRALMGGTDAVRPRKTLKQQITQHAVILVMLLGLAIYRAYPTYLDIARQQYVMVTASYERTSSSSERTLFSSGYAYFMQDGERIHLELPADWTEDEFPLGTYQGALWYSQESKVLLSFSPIDSQ